VGENMNLSEKLKELHKEQSLREIAKTSGVHHTYIKKLCDNNPPSPTINKYLMICTNLGLDPKEFLE